MKLIVTTPTKQEIFDIAWLECETPSGNFVVKRGHKPMIVTIEYQNPLKILLRSGKQHMIPVHQGGIVHVNRDEIRVLLDT